MLRRGLVAAAAAGALMAGVDRADAAGAWLSAASLTPTEHRVAVAVGPSRTTLWTSLRFDAAGGSMAIVVPAPPGSSLDFSSDAWFEALEIATAPRLFPPVNVDPFCPGKSGSPDVFQLDGQTGHAVSLSPQDVQVLGDAAAVEGWAAQAGFTVPSATQDALGKLAGTSFVAVRFDAPAGPGVTRTLRVAMPSAPPMLPLALTQAGGDDLRVTAWLIGAGRADLIGGSEVTVSTIAWRAKEGDTDYEDRRASVLASDPTRFLVEQSSHEALGQTTSIADGTASIDGVVTTFFERAAAYGDGDFGSSLCIALADNALVSSSPVAASCPRAALGVVQPAAACVESPGAGEIDPAKLRCGPGADDLAVALSGAAPSATWLTRQSLVIPASGQGSDWFVGFVAGPTQSPVLLAQSVDTSGCADGGAPDGGMSSGSTSSGVLTGSGSGAVATGVGGHGVGNGAGSGTGAANGSGGAGPEVADAACACAGAGTQAAADSCNADSSSTSGCSGDSSSSDACSGSSSEGSSEACSSGSGSSDSCSGSGSSESCSGSSSGESCSGSGSSFGNCSTAGARRVRAPRFSVLAFAALALLTPLRRRGRKSRRRR